MNNVRIDPAVLALGQALSEGFTSIAAKERLTAHAMGNPRKAAKAERRAAIRAHKAAIRREIVASKVDEAILLDARREVGLS